ncbi:MAG: amylo-alpha-1,6-glucosidase [Desulfobacterium sp.]|nr:amylo-alpha-1,6-glucosidase [Desulfobacterium sp.]
MNVSELIIQNPEPGTSRVMFCGDVVTFTLTVPAEKRGMAWIRTNLGRAEISRNEIIARVDRNEIKLDEAWHDIQMIRQGPSVFEITLPLCEVGHFKAKCFFWAEDSDEPVWPTGEDSVINVEPAGTCCANIVYNAFVRQFGPTRSQGQDLKKEEGDCIRLLDQKGYAVIPSSGKFRDLSEKIDFIFNDLGCRAIHLLPIHPTPTTYGRMGRFGSPYAALNFTDVDPALAEFDSSATPLEQFIALVDKAHSSSGYVILDIAINHTGWAASIHEKHPEWLVRDEEGNIEVPGAWGVVWADLTRLDYSKKALWRYMADIFLLWCGRGVDGFRCDAGYMIPVPAWEYIVARVKQEYPDTLFFLEGLGGPLEATWEILNKANFNWAYSELFQIYDRRAFEAYLPRAISISEKFGHMIHFAETHDNQRLAATSILFAQMRTSISALFSVCGGFGFANGVEWFAKEKINVHDSVSLNWGAKINQVDHIRRLNLILRTHPAFGPNVKLNLVQEGQGNYLVLSRSIPTTQREILVIANLDCDKKQEALWKKGQLGSDGTQPGEAVSDVFFDLVTEKRVVAKVDRDLLRVTLEPGEVMALTRHQRDIELLKKADMENEPMPWRVVRQKQKACVLRIVTTLAGYNDVSGIDLDHEADALIKDPLEFVRSFNPDGKESRVVVWEWDKDVRRKVMIPHGFFLMVVASDPFRAEIRTPSKDGITIEQNESLATDDGRNFAIFLPHDTRGRFIEHTLRIRVFTRGKAEEAAAPLVHLPGTQTVFVSSTFTGKAISKDPTLKLLGVNHRGGMMRAFAWWGRIESRYDALLAANINPDYPEDRWMALARFRIWVIYQGYSRELTLDCLESFTFSYANMGLWRFRVPTSEGSHCPIEITLRMVEHKNAVEMIVKRLSGSSRKHLLGDDKKVTLVIRPDLEHRSFHETSKAWQGPESLWKSAVSMIKNGFSFVPDVSRCTLSVKASDGSFVEEPEWQYMVHRSLDAQRGLDPYSDLFSPGYFTTTLGGSQALLVLAHVTCSKEDQRELFPMDVNSSDSEFAGIDPELTRVWPLSEALDQSLDAFVVTRGQDKSVIAGYPWFLDWGRDSLIFSRALIQAERLEDARKILRLFGRFEQNGTLPNMISGNDARNRNTSDAPMWFLAAAREMVEKDGLTFLDEPLGYRTIRKVLLSIGNAYIRGTVTGVAMDPETGLIYSPSHFTWMDTNYPAGTPREGYPIEIQALWAYGLDFLAAIDPEGAHDWARYSILVKESVRSLFFLEQKGYFSDCLHSRGMAPARRAVVDDALRPNQLFLISLGVIQDEDMCIPALEHCMALLVPGGIRTLDDRKVVHPLEIKGPTGLLNDPLHPYWGHYLGDEDTRRKPAYHNGTAWTWVFPVFCEAWGKIFGPKGEMTAISWLTSSVELMRCGAAGFLPEIMDGDAPHKPRGCDAQAWGTSELARVWRKFTWK